MGPCVIADSRKKMAGLAVLSAFLTQLLIRDTLVASAVVAAFGLAACWSAMRAWRPRSHVVIDGDGVTYVPVGLHLAWSEIAQVRIESYQTMYDLRRRLVIVGVDADLVASRWTSPRFRAPVPRDGRVELELALTTPSWEQIADAIERCSGRAVDNQRVSRFAGVRVRS